MKKLGSLLLSLLITGTLAHAALTDADKSLIPGIALNSNPGAELSTAGWATYHNGTTAPSTGMTGGTMTGNITFSRTTTVGEVIDRGNASFKIVKAAANAQGDGVSTTFTFAAMPRSGLVTMPIKILSGSVVQGDVKVFCWDNTNGALITPSYNDVLGTAPITPSFPIPSTTTSLTCGVHFASTSTNAVTFTYKFLVNSQTAITGMAGSDWLSDKTFTPTNFGTVSANQIQYRRVGDSLHVRGVFQSGTQAAAAADITLPSGLSIDTSKLPTQASTQMVGTWTTIRVSSTAALTITTNRYGLMFVDGSTTNKVFFSVNAASNQFQKDTGATIADAANAWFTIDFTVPIAGWSSNVTMASSSQFRISSYLANGTRVTGSAPTALGQYRSQLRAAAGTSFSDTNGAPTIAPSASSGIAIYYNTYSAGDSSGQPSKYDIFVGKNKNVQFKFYQTTGFSGFVDVTPFLSGTSSFGYYTSYDPSTGIATIVKNHYGTSTANAGVDSSGTAPVSTQIYADIIVSENALAVGVQAPRSEILVSGANGYGSTNTKIRRFSTILKNIGTAITYADSATLGASFTINEDGLYSVKYMDSFTGGSFVGITRSTTQPTTNVESLSNISEIIDIQQTSGANALANAGDTLNLSAGDVIRPHTEGTAVGTGGPQMFRITKVNN